MKNNPRQPYLMWREDDEKQEHNEQLEVQDAPTENAIEVNNVHQWEQMEF